MQLNATPPPLPAARSFDQVNQIADQIDEAQRALGMVGSHLSAATELIVLLIKYRSERVRAVGTAHRRDGRGDDQRFRHPL